jgi:hypothetical protein
MIVFDLKCPHGHRFEVWFRSSRDYEEQLAHNEVECPVCGGTDVSKAVMAPNLGAKGNQARENQDRANKDHAHTADPARDASPSPQESAIESDYIDQLAVGMSSLPSDLQSELENVLAKVQKHVDENCDYVGGDFPEEARKIHYGEADARSIYGEASEEDASDLLEEGIDFMPLPLVRKPGPTDA